MSHINTVTETCKPEPNPQIGNLLFGEVFKSLNGDAYYMRIDGGVIHLGTGIYYTNPNNKQYVRRVSQVTITRYDPTDC